MRLLPRNSDIFGRVPAEWMGPLQVIAKRLLILAVTVLVVGAVLRKLGLHTVGTPLMIAAAVMVVAAVGALVVRKFG